MASEQNRCIRAEITRDCPHGHDWIDGRAYHGRYTQQGIDRDRRPSQYRDVRGFATIVR